MLPGNWVILFCSGIFIYSQSLSMIVLWLFFFCFSVLLLFLGRRITYWLYSRRMDGRMNEWKKATLPQSPYSGWRVIGRKHEIGAFVFLSLALSQSVGRHLTVSCRTPPSSTTYYLFTNEQALLALPPSLRLIYVGGCCTSTDNESLQVFINNMK